MLSRRAGIRSAGRRAPQNVGSGSVVDFFNGLLIRPNQGVRPQNGRFVIFLTRIKFFSGSLTGGFTGSGAVVYFRAGWFVERGAYVTFVVQVRIALPGSSSYLLVVTSATFKSTLKEKRRVELTIARRLRWAEGGMSGI